MKQTGNRESGIGNRTEALGLKWDAGAGRLIIAPRLAEGSDWVRATNVRCGATVLDVKVRRRKGGLELRIWKRIGPAIWIALAPWLPEAPSAVEIDGDRIQARATTDGDGVRASVEFQASAEHEVVFTAPSP